MVFSSLPLYHLDPPNWSQPNEQPPSNESPHLLSPPSSMMLANQPSAQNQSNTGSNGGVSRPGSMAERARLAKIPQPEPALKCPRCDSANTKFCYFNNYSLSQPRHFCKTCRRYWTRGGALRNVPVGGGCRRNKRSSNKSSSNKSGGGGGGGTSSSAAAAAASSSSCSTATSGSTVIPSNFGSHHQLPFLSSLADQYSAAAANLGLNFSSLQQQQQQQLDAGDYGNSSVNGLDQWRIQQIQQFPFLGGLDSSSSAAQIAGIYPNFDGEGFHHMPSKAMSSTTASGLITQLASVKMEDSQQQAALSLPRQYLGIPGNDQYLGGGWAGDLSGFNSSSGNML